MLEVRNHGSLLEVSGALDARGGMTLGPAVARRVDAARQLAGWTEQQQGRE